MYKFINYLLKVKGNSIGYESLLLLLAGGVPARGVVGGGEEHGEEQQHRHQQIRDVYGEQQPALPRRLRTRQRFPGKLMEKDVTQDGEQRGGDMGRVQHGGGPDPPTAA